MNIPIEYSNIPWIFSTSYYVSTPLVFTIFDKKFRFKKNVPKVIYRKSNANVRLDNQQEADAIHQILTIEKITNISRKYEFNKTRNYFSRYDIPFIDEKESC